MTRNRVIGVDGRLPWDLPDEMAHFRRTTRGAPVIMGRKTFEAMASEPLPNRQNIVLSSNNLQFAEIETAKSLTAAIELAKVSRAAECFVIGGARVYEEALTMADRLYCTEIDAELDGDTYFPSVQWDRWHLVTETFHDADARHAYGFAIRTYDRA